MNPDTLIRAARSSFGTYPTAKPYNGPLLEQAYQLGCDRDADAVFVATMTDEGELACMLVVGRRRLFGLAAGGWAFEYVDGDPFRASDLMCWLASAAEQLTRISEVMLMMKGVNEKRRSFRCVDLVTA